MTDRAALAPVDGPRKRLRLALLLIAICIVSLLLLALSWLPGPRPGPDGLILLVPWFLTPSLHGVLGPLALFLVWRSPVRGLRWLVTAWFLLSAGGLALVVGE